PIRAATIAPPAPIQATRIPTGLFLATRMTIADACPRSEGVERCAKAAEPMHVPCAGWVGCGQGQPSPKGRLWRALMAPGRQLGRGPRLASQCPCGPPARPASKRAQNLSALLWGYSLPLPKAKAK